MDAFNISESNININNKTELSIEFYIGLFLNLMVALPENSYVIWLIVTGAGNGVASEFFSLSLSVCELFFCLWSFLSLFCHTFPRVWLVTVFLQGIPFTGRPLFQCLICVERYLAVVHPVTFLKYKPLRYRVICSTVVWIMIVIVCVFTTTLHMYVFICYYLCQALLTLSVKLFCCLAVLRALKQSGPGERGREREKENHMKRRAFNTIVQITMAILLIYAAYLMAGLVYVLTQQYIPELWSAGQICFLLGGLVQPLLYLHRTGKLPFCKAL